MMMVVVEPSPLRPLSLAIGRLLLLTYFIAELYSKTVPHRTRTTTPHHHTAPTHRSHHTAPHHHTLRTTTRSHHTSPTTLLRTKLLRTTTRSAPHRSAPHYSHHAAPQVTPGFEHWSRVIADAGMPAPAAELVLVISLLTAG